MRTISLHQYCSKKEDQAGLFGIAWQFAPSRPRNSLSHYISDSFISTHPPSTFSTLVRNYIYEVHTPSSHRQLTHNDSRRVEVFPDYQRALCYINVKVFRFVLAPDFGHASIPYPRPAQASRELYKLFLAVLQRCHTRQAKRFGHLL